ncbi:MAG: flagellar M-ring protein FliF C-terminal domain-containing protein [Eubacteriales bacterium]
MAEKLQSIINKIMEWWNRFESKQKTIIIGVAVAVLMTFVLLITVLTRPQYVHLVTLETAKDAAEVQDMLESEGITPKISDDGLIVEVASADKSQANLVLAENGVPTSAYTLEDVFSGGFTTTETEVRLKTVAYLESNMKIDLESYDFVKRASVTIDLPDNDGTLIAREEEGTVSILLELNGAIPADTASGIAVFAKNVIGNESTNNIVIMDTQGNMLYSGNDDYSLAGSASSQLTIKQQAENIVAADVRRVLFGTGNFGIIEVASNLVVDFSTYDSTAHTFALPDGQEAGLITHEETFSSEATGGVSGVPGTDSNSEETYVYQDGSYSEQATSEEIIDRVVDETITTQNIPPGLIQYDQSSISVTAISYNVQKQEEVDSQGLLDGISWSEYKIANQGRTRLEVDEDLFGLVANATGIALDKISIVAYSEPVFVDKEGFSAEPQDIVQIVLIILILGLLGFVVFRTMVADKEEPPEEIAVENLLQSIQEEEVEEITTESKSETRRVIEKFVEDNPEAVANLLRNWLGEGWG